MGARRGTGRALRTGLAAAMTVLVAASAPSGAPGQEPSDGQRVRGGPPPEELARAVTAVEELDALRSRLARAFGEGGAEPDRETFAKVCRPVGARAAGIARRNGWRVEQLSEKFRNPAHAPDAGARRVLGILERRPEVGGLWLRTVRDGRSGTRYFRRIVVEPACLACHGAREERPAFVKRAYPRDRAHGFEPGDLRGVYAVFVPDAGDGGSESGGKRE